MIKLSHQEDLEKSTEPSSVILSPVFAVLTSRHECWTCAAVVPVSALWVPSFVERFDDGEELSVADAAVLRFVETINLPAAQHISSAAPWMLMSTTKGSGARYLANHCQACSVVQGDFQLFGVDGPFGLVTLEKRGTEHISVRYVDCAIEAVAGIAQATWIDQISARNLQPQ
ncbi:hypothetical protein [Stenotrophomonas sp. BIO128-Bstrain]|uniref:hypothetical protein n=1 Tax=Stenotrophomonas sp. BIO128-Bstrain TaxID=3027225 RepID=UPI0024DEAF16|nr:hypothetical protein [Stenotrophomonas sp. BIO128-Bstrain]WIA63231.1 hypothetical protein POS15_08475 [Stenotrophomonas sp. BIO128-Bstrain]